MAPDKSVAMPTLMGGCAAFAHRAGITQLPTPVAIAPAVHALACRKRRRLNVHDDSCDFLNMVHALPREYKPSGRNRTMIMAMTKTRTSASTGEIAQGSAADRKS